MLRSRLGNYCSATPTSRSIITKQSLLRLKEALLKFVNWPNLQFESAQLRQVAQL